MRALLLIAATVALSACGNNDQADNTQNVDQNLSADSIVSNDVTAIDAVTGDAANMAADVDTNFGNLDMTAGNMTNEARPSKHSAGKPSPAKPAPTEANTAAAAANTTANAE